MFEQLDFFASSEGGEGGTGTVVSDSSNHEGQAVNTDTDVGNDNNTDFVAKDTVNVDDFNKLKLQLDKFTKTTEQAEHTIKELRSTNAKLKQDLMATKSDEEKVIEREAEAAAAKKEAFEFLSRAKATEVFTSAKLTEDDYKDLLDSIVTEDKEKTSLTAMQIATLVQTVVKRTEKAMREKILNETPPAPSGSTNSAIDSAYDAKVHRAMGLKHKRA